MLPLVSVIIPSYNHEFFIVDAIESVLGQSYSNYEIIIIDDGSTDNTLKKIDCYRSNNVKIIAQENHGAHAAINRGIAEAGGDFLTILNSDDLYHPARLEKLVQHACSNDAGLVFTGLKMIDGHGDLYNGARWEQYQGLCEECMKRPELNYFLLGNVAYTTSNFFFQRKILEKVGTFKNLRYTHDWNWMLRSSFVTDPVWLHDELLCYRVHETNTLNESALWFSILEDSYNFACYLYGLLKRKQAVESLFDIYLSLLIKNTSFIPFFVSFFLSLLLYKAVANEDELLELVNNQDFGNKMKELMESSSYDSFTFHSLHNINSIVQSWRTQIDMIQNRDDCIKKSEVMIQDRDECIKRYAEEVSCLTQALHATFDHKIKKMLKKFINIIAW